MPERLSLATVATCAALAGAAFGGAYALAHDGAAEPAPALGSPTALRVADEPIGELRRASPLPALKMPPPRREPAPFEPVPVEEPLPDVSAPAPVEPTPTPPPAPTPAPTPQPAPDPSPPAKPPLTFDDSG